MNGDLSLSQALGGLRIANPDDANDAHDASATALTNEADTTPPTRELPASEVIQHGTQGIDIIDSGIQTAGPGTPASPASQSINNAAAQSSYARTPGSVSGSQRSVRYETQDSPLSAHQMQYAAVPGDPTHSRRTSRGRTASYGPVASLSGSTRSTAEEWKDRGAAVGVRREIDASGRTVVRQVKKGVRDFAFAHILGEGSYSTVYLATDRQTLKEFAIKVLEKRHIIKEKKIKYVNIEKDTLNRLTEHPGIVRLYYTFQDETSLYYVLDLCNGGELLGVLKKTGTFDVDCTRFYAAQILDAIDYMHSRGVIHRDLKPENVLLDDQMHIKITDFGTAKLLKDPREPSKAGTDDQHPSDSTPGEADDSRAASFVGTAEYVSPELLTHKNACKSSDLWAFGCIVYQLLAGRPPFKAGSEYLTFQKIVNLEYEFPAGFPPAARDLVERCLVLDPARRLTIEHIKNHEFFEGQKFGRSLWRTKAPRLRPYVPPPQEPNIIQLNGFSSNQPKASHPTRQHHSASNGSARPSRIITELPPPTQLDIEWSPVLTRNNERILKLGDLMVISNPLPNGQNGKASDEGHKKLSRFFGGNTTKKRQRLVMVTSSGRILLAPAGGDEKRSKHEISLLSSECSWRTQRDAKGLLTWSVDSGGYHYSFEELKGANPEGGAASADGWIDSLERAKDLAVSQDMNSYGNDNDFADMTSTGLSLSSTSGNRGNGQDGMDYNDKRSQLTKNQSGVDDPALKRHRFSKRQSRNGLGSAF